MDRSYSQSKYMRKLKHSNKKKSGYKYINHVDKKITYHIKEKYVEYTPLAIRANFNHDEYELLLINNNHENIEIHNIDNDINKFIKRKKKARYSRNNRKNDKFKNIKSKSISKQSYLRCNLDEMEDINDIIIDKDYDHYQRHFRYPNNNKNVRISKWVQSKRKRKHNTPNPHPQPSRSKSMSSLYSIRKQFQQNPNTFTTKSIQIRLSPSPHKPLKNMGYALPSNEYPSKSTKHPKSRRLIQIFGDSYQNILWSTRNKDNSWVARKLLTSTIKLNISTIKIVNRELALNEKTGNIAMMTMTHIFIFKLDKSSNMLTLTSLHEFTSDQVLQNEDKQLSRLRFINNQLFVFSYTRATIFVFEITQENKIELTRSLQETYFSEAGVVDIVVTDELLIISFSRWLGIYKLQPTLEWYHAVSYSTTDVTSPYKIEMTVFDDAEDRDCMENDAYFEDWKQIEQPVVDKYYKETSKNYMIIATQNSLIGIHPVNPKFDFLHVASDVQYDVRFCSSKFYGVFYTKDNGERLYQSPHMECRSCQEIFNLNHVNVLFGAKRICDVVYDELYGISGRLLIFWESNDGEMLVHQMVNYDELVHFSGTLDIGDVDIYGIPGVLVVYVYQMLYGDELIAKLVQR